LNHAAETTNCLRLSAKKCDNIDNMYIKMLPKLDFVEKDTCLPEFDRVGNDSPEQEAHWMK
jgi:hypothetical protein